jgi:hypothetical protein
MKHTMRLRANIFKIHVWSPICDKIFPILQTSSIGIRFGMQNIPPLSSLLISGHCSCKTNT